MVLNSGTRDSGRNYQRTEAGQGVGKSIQVAAARPLPSSLLEQEARVGTTILDVRSPAAFAKGHIPGSVNVGIDGYFAGCISCVVPKAARIIIVGDPGREQEAIFRMQRLGYVRVIGWLEGGMAAWQKIGRWSESLRSVRPQDLAHGNRPADGGAIVDVRMEVEWNRDPRMNVTNLPLALLSQQVALLPAGPITLICDSGYRASIAASMLLRLGITDVRVVLGGWGAVDDAPRVGVHMA